jgi:hypothetical protein
VAADLYKKSKRFIPIKTVFCRVVDPFFECLYACCGGYISEFQQKYPDFKVSTFKGAKKDNKCACYGHSTDPPADPKGIQGRIVGPTSVR